MMRAHWTAIVTALPFALGLVGCTIDSSKVEGSIRDQLKEKGAEIASVACPPNQKSAKDTAFDCSGKSVSGDEFKVHVKVTDDKGGISWDLVGKLADPKEVSTMLGGKLGGSFDCGSKILVAVKGTKMVCKFNGKESTITFKDDDGNVDLNDLVKAYGDSIAAQ